MTDAEKAEQCETTTSENPIEVVGPTREGQFIAFGVKRRFKCQRKIYENFTLTFKILYEERTGKWHHSAMNDRQKDSLCRERLFIPERDCACIRACKGVLNDRKGR